MKTYEPRLPNLTITEIEQEYPLGYKIIIEVLRKAALHLYHASPATNKLGLEKCMETLIELIDTGFAKIIYDEDESGEEYLCLGFFNSSTGRYQVPGEEPIEEYGKEFGEDYE